MIEVGKVYEIKVGDYHGLLTHQRIIANVEFKCESINDDVISFYPVDYKGAVPDGKAQGMESFTIGISEASQYRFIEQPETTRKIQDGVLSRKL